MTERGFKALLRIAGRTVEYDGQTFQGILSQAKIADAPGVSNAEEFILKAFASELPDGIREGSYVSVEGSTYKVQTVVPSGIYSTMTVYIS